MDYDAFNHYCGSLPATSHVIQWGDSHVWKVGGKVFAIGGWSKNTEEGQPDQPAFTFKTSETNFVFLSQHEGYRPAPYFANRGMKWIQQIDTRGDLDEELKYYLSESHRLAAENLSKKKQKELGLISS